MVVFWIHFFGFYTYTASCANPYRLHRVCTITAQNTFHRSCGQALSIYPYSIRTDLFHTTFQNFTNSLQTRYKFVTSDLHTHVLKRIQSAICTNVVYSFNINACTTRLHTSTWVAIQFNIQPNNSIIASDKVH